MTIAKTEISPALRILKSIGSVFLGVLAIFVLSLGTDQILHVLDVYPPWGQPMHEPSLNFLALSYRIPYAVVGSYITAKFAPQNPLRHAIILGVVGIGLSTLGVVGSWNLDLGPRWYPISLVIISLPFSWLGGKLYERNI